MEQQRANFAKFTTQQNSRLEILTLTVVELTSKVDHNHGRLEEINSKVDCRLEEVDSRLKDLYSKVASNHGHITKRLFPPLETKFTAFEADIAAKTTDLEAKGGSLLAQLTILKNTVMEVVETKLATLESAVGSTHAPASRAAGPREPPDDPPPWRDSWLGGGPWVRGCSKGDLCPSGQQCTMPLCWE